MLSAIDETVMINKLLKLKVSGPGAGHIRLKLPRLQWQLLKYAKNRETLYLLQAIPDR